MSPQTLCPQPWSLSLVKSQKLNYAEVMTGQPYAYSHLLSRDRVSFFGRFKLKRLLRIVGSYAEVINDRRGPVPSNGDVFEALTLRLLHPLVTCRFSLTVCTTVRIWSFCPEHASLEYK